MSDHRNEALKEFEEGKLPIDRKSIEFVLASLLFTTKSDTVNTGNMTAFFRKMEENVKNFAKPNPYNTELYVKYAQLGEDKLEEILSDLNNINT